MRKANREINVFSLSAMDLFASAMGAFMLICLVALPYYLDAGEQRQQVAELREQNRNAQSGLEQMRERIEQENRQEQQDRQQVQRQQEQLQQQQQQMQGMRRNLAETGLVIMAKWDTSADVDLYVVSPEGYEYGATKHNRRPPGGTSPRPHYPDEDAELSLDANGSNPRIPNAVGRNGIEVWLAIGAGPGDYKIYLQRCPRPEEKNAPNLSSRSEHVELTVIYRDGYLYKPVSGVMLSGDPNSRPAASCAMVTMDSEGNVTLR